MYTMTLSWEEAALRLGLALLLGGLIGLERQWRSHYVGLRTNTLVALGSAAMTLCGEMVSASEPYAIVHVLAGIVTGIGFIGGGVIIQEGLTVRGCNTAATLWCSVAVGLFAGAGFMAAAAILGIIVVLVNLTMRPIVYYINEKALTANPSPTDEYKREV
jgi:putative Mg2+ transporter-C (MgtC) family protein